MKFEVNAPRLQGALMARPDELLEFARLVDDLGYDYLTTGLGGEQVAYLPGAQLGDHPIPVAGDIPDSLEVAAFLAAATKRVVLKNSFILPCHHPLVTAKRLATVDVLTRGRLRSLVMLGWVQPVHEWCNTDFPSRGRRADEMIDVMRLLWAADETGATFHGEFFSFDDALSYPKPYGGRSIPFDIGGASRGAMKRAALRGDGYFPTARIDPRHRGHVVTSFVPLTDDEFAEQVREVRRMAVEAERDPAAIEFVRFSSLKMNEDDVAAMAALGADRLVLTVNTDDFGRVSDQLSAFADRLSLR